MPHRFFTIFLIFLCSCHLKKKSDNPQSILQLTIHEFYPYHDSALIVINKDSTKDKLDFFLVKNYENNLRSDSVIEEFTKTYKDPTWQKYNSYQMVFYKESIITNDTSIKMHPRNLDRYSQENDWIFSYDWSNGKLIRKRKIINGEYVDTSGKITVQDTRIDTATFPIAGFAAVDWTFYLSKPINTLLIFLDNSFPGYILGDVYPDDNLKAAARINVYYRNWRGLILHVNRFHHMDPFTTQTNGKWDVNLFRQENISRIELWDNSILVFDSDP